MCVCWGGRGGRQLSLAQEEFCAATVVCKPQHIAPLPAGAHPWPYPAAVLFSLGAVRGHGRGRVGGVLAVGQPVLGQSVLHLPHDGRVGSGDVHPLADVPKAHVKQAWLGNRARLAAEPPEPKRRTAMSRLRSWDEMSEGGRLCHLSSASPHAATLSQEICGAAASGSPARRQTRCPLPPRRTCRPKSGRHLRGPRHKHGTAVSGWKQQLVSQSGVSDHTGGAVCRCGGHQHQPYRRGRRARAA